MERTAAARFGAAAFWIVAGTMHFVIPRQYEAIVPPRIARWRKEIVGERPGRDRRRCRGPAGRHPPRRALVAAGDAGRGVSGQHPHGAAPRAVPKIPAAALGAAPVQGIFALLTWNGTLTVLKGVRPPKSRNTRRG